MKGYANAGPYVDAQPLHLTVPPPPTMTVDANDSSVRVGETIHISTTFANAPNGTVSFYNYE